jgi:hypothetical protein
MNCGGWDEILLNGMRFAYLIRFTLAPSLLCVTGSNLQWETKYNRCWIFMRFITQSMPNQSGSGQPKIIFRNYRIRKNILKNEK